MEEDPLDGRLPEDRLRDDDFVALDAVERDAAVLFEVALREDVVPLEEEELGRRVVMLPARCEVVRVVR